MYLGPCPSTVDLPDRTIAQLSCVSIRRVCGVGGVNEPGSAFFILSGDVAQERAERRYRMKSPATREELAMDRSRVHPSSARLAHRIDLHLGLGASQNLDEGRPIQILLNDGRVVGF